MSDLLFDGMREIVNQKGKRVILSDHPPDHNQKNILIHRSNPETRLIPLMVIATAGSGKTTLLKMLGQQLIDMGEIQEGQRAIFLAFNKDVVEKLRKELPNGLEVATLNSIGNRILREQKPDVPFQPKKYDQLISNTVANRNYARKEAKNVREALQESVQISMGNALRIGSDSREWKDIMKEFGVSINGMEDDLYSMTMEIMQEGMRMVDENEAISFLDQIYAPFHFNWNLAQPYDYILVDEAQDLTLGQIGLVVFSISHDQSQITCVGDPSQAIYQFTGASHNSMLNIQEMLDAHTLPLSVTYRCPSNHVELARPYTTEIEPAPHAKTGPLDDISGEEFISKVDRDALVICRTNAPLINWAYRLAKYGKKCYVLGREISAGMVNFAKEATVWNGQKVQRSKVNEDMELIPEVFETQLQRYHLHLTRKLAAEKEKNPSVNFNEDITLTDRMEAVQMVFREKECKTLGELIEAIRELFQKSADSIKLSSIHKAKGLEARTVYILEPQLLPHPSAKTDEEKIAERAVQFVAYTRSKHALLMVEGDETSDSVIPEHLRKPIKQDQTP